ncbi:hypothetical protein Nepgr_029574 [Nepenthes gracilis]|uniref:Uncharacterized protein n=1 Tax=Nepenthes gracilis TaxID=150966 RepID=A0AAD3TEG9_NEPGR|nr:hypothetical protein Nepgr_029574 [Nepenthes gracilis]
MAVSFNSFVGLVSASGTGAAVVKSTHVSKPLVMSKSWGYIKCRRRPMHVFVADGDRMITDASNNDARITDGPPSPSLDVSLPPQRHLEAKTENDSELPTSDASTPRRTSLTARERLRAARVLSRYSESKATKSEMGSSVLDALRESDKGKKGLPEAPTNLFDDSKRGLPDQGLTFNFPGGVDLLIIAFSVVFISTVMFATTYIVWKAGAIHFNEY